MADVMVVAIFMAYIGFNGIISDQLGRLNTVSEEMVLLTTNGTSLQPGYYLFLTYTLLALFLSDCLPRSTMQRSAGIPILIRSAKTISRPRRLQTLLPPLEKGD